MNRETRIGIGIVALLGAFVFGLLVIGSIGEPREELQRLTVAQVLAQDLARRTSMAVASCGSWAGTHPWTRDCVEPAGPPASTVPWLEHHCPLRVLMPAQPART